MREQKRKGGRKIRKHTSQEIMERNSRSTTDQSAIVDADDPEGWDSR